ncbi:hypothetical protein BB558_003441 [Smittium angustum]|uniref:1-phosphatidylinositol-3-phosphate 5-kinase n=1 Tax=Smittium angustum TaxID=133377 RepID=A0A2U1J633_SMIAN|nr:hypothetical protein BB558_003441 [Smittium angustum]
MQFISFEDYDRKSNKDNEDTNSISRFMHKIKSFSPTAIFSSNESSKNPNKLITNEDNASTDLVVNSDRAVLNHLNKIIVSSSQNNATPKKTSLNLTKNFKRVMQSESGNETLRPVSQEAQREKAISRASVFRPESRKSTRKYVNNNVNDNSESTTSSKTHQSAVIYDSSESNSSNTAKNLKPFVPRGSIDIHPAFSKINTSIELIANSKNEKEFSPLFTKRINNLSRDIQKETKSTTYNSFKNIPLLSGNSPNFSTFIFPKVNKDNQEFWLKDDSVYACMCCELTFTAFRRKHHCRLCGKVFCYSCLDNFVTLEISGKKDSYRICKFCWKEYQKSLLDENSLYKRYESTKSSDQNPNYLEKAKELKKYKSNPLTESVTLSTRKSLGIVKPSNHENIEIENNIQLPTKNKEHFRTKSETSKLSIKNGEKQKKNSISILKNEIFLEPSPTIENNDASFTKTNLNSNMLTLPGYDSGFVFAKNSINIFESETNWQSTRMFQDLNTEPTLLSSKSLLQTQIQLVHPEDVYLSSEESGTDLDSDPNINKISEIKNTILNEIISINENNKVAINNRNGWCFSQMFTEKTQTHLKRICLQLMRDKKVEEPKRWLPIVIGSVIQAVDNVHPGVEIGGSNDLANYIKIKTIPGGLIDETRYISGIVFTKDLVHKHMKRSLNDVRIMIISFSLSYNRGVDRYISLNSSVEQEKEYTNKLVARIMSSNPNLLLLEKDISQLALNGLFNQGVSVISGMKSKTLQSIAYFTGADIVTSLDKLALGPSIGRCKSMYSQSYNDSKSPQGYKNLIFLDGCSSDKGGTIILRGSTKTDLIPIKKIMKMLTSLSYSLALESSLLLNQFGMIAQDKNVYLEELLTTVIEHSEACSALQKYFQIVLTTSPFVKIKFPYDLRRMLKAEKELKILNDKFTHLNLDFDEVSGIAAPIVPSVPEELQGALPYLVLNQHKITDESRTFQSYRSEAAPLEERIRTGKEFLKRNPNPPSLWENQNLVLIYIVSQDQTQCNGCNLTCVEPQIHQIDFHFNSDVTLGQYIQEMCFDLDVDCPGFKPCNEPLYHHVRSYIHGDGRVDVSMSEHPCPLSGMSEVLLMWAECKECKAKTPYASLSYESWHISFGKYLELFFYGEKVIPRAQICQHKLYHDFVHWFAYRNMAVKFNWRRVKLYDVYPPSSPLNFAIETNINLKSQEAAELEKRLTLYFDSLLNNIKSFPFDLIADEFKLQYSITLDNLSQRAQSEKEYFQKLLNLTVENSHPANTLSLTVIHEKLQVKVIEWDIYLSEFYSEFLKLKSSNLISYLNSKKSGSFVSAQQKIDGSGLGLLLSRTNTESNLSMNSKIPTNAFDNQSEKNFKIYRENAEIFTKKRVDTINLFRGDDKEMPLVGTSPNSEHSLTFNLESTSPKKKYRTSHFRRLSIEFMKDEREKEDFIRVETKKKSKRAQQKPSDSVDQESSFNKYVNSKDPEPELKSQKVSVVRNKYVGENEPYTYLGANQTQDIQYSPNKLDSKFNEISLTQSGKNTSNFLSIGSVLAPKANKLSFDKDYSAGTPSRNIQKKKFTTFSSPEPNFIPKKYAPGKLEKPSSNVRLGDLVNPKSRSTITRFENRYMKAGVQHPKIDSRGSIFYGTSAHGPAAREPYLRSYPTPKPDTSDRLRQKPLFSTKQRANTDIRDVAPGLLELLDKSRALKIGNGSKNKTNSNNHNIISTSDDPETQVREILSFAEKLNPKEKYIIEAASKHLESAPKQQGVLLSSSFQNINLYPQNLDMPAIKVLSTKPATKNLYEYRGKPKSKQKPEFSGDVNINPKMNHTANITSRRIPNPNIHRSETNNSLSMKDTKPIVKNIEALKSPIPSKLPIKRYESNKKENTISMRVSGESSTKSKLKPSSLNTTTHKYIKPQVARPIDHGSSITPKSKYIKPPLPNFRKLSNNSTTNIHTGSINHYQNRESSRNPNQTRNQTQFTTKPSLTPHTGVESGNKDISKDQTHKYLRKSNSGSRMNLTLANKEKSIKNEKVEVISKSTAVNKNRIRPLSKFNNDVIKVVGSKSKLGTYTNVSTDIDHNFETHGTNPRRNISIKNLKNKSKEKQGNGKDNITPSAEYNESLSSFGSKNSSFASKVSIDGLSNYGDDNLSIYDGLNIVFKEAVDIPKTQSKNEHKTVSGKYKLDHNNLKRNSLTHKNNSEQTMSRKLNDNQQEKPFIFNLQSKLKPLHSKWNTFKTSLFGPQRYREFNQTGTENDLNKITSNGNDEFIPQEEQHQNLAGHQQASVDDYLGMNFVSNPVFSNNSSKNLENNNSKTAFPDISLFAKNRNKHMRHFSDTSNIESSYSKLVNRLFYNQENSESLDTRNNCLGKNKNDDLKHKQLDNTTFFTSGDANLDMEKIKIPDGVQNIELDSPSIFKSKSLVTTGLRGRLSTISSFGTSNDSESDYGLDSVFEFGSRQRLNDNKSSVSSSSGSDLMLASENGLDRILSSNESDDIKNFKSKNQGLSSRSKWISSRKHKSNSSYKTGVSSTQSSDSEKPILDYLSANENKDTTPLQNRSKIRNKLSNNKLRNGKFGTISENQLNISKSHRPRDTRIPFHKSKKPHLPHHYPSDKTQSLLNAPHDEYMVPDRPVIGVDTGSFVPSTSDFLYSTLENGQIIKIHGGLHYLSANSSARPSVSSYAISGQVNENDSQIYAPSHNFGESDTFSNSQAHSPSANNKSMFGITEELEAHEDVVNPANQLQGLLGNGKRQGLLENNVDEKAIAKGNYSVSNQKKYVDLSSHYKSGDNVQNQFWKGLLGLLQISENSSLFNLGLNLKYPLLSTDHVIKGCPIIIRETEPSSVVAFILASPNYQAQLGKLYNKYKNAEAMDKENDIINQAEDRFLDEKENSQNGFGVDYTSIEGNNEVDDEKKDLKEKGLGGYVENEFDIDYKRADRKEIEQVLLRSPARHVEFGFVSGQTQFNCKLYFISQFEALRSMNFCELTFIESLSRCTRFTVTGGKSGSSFLKTFDDRYILKQVSKAEMNAFMEFAPSYFEQVTKNIKNSTPSLLIKILGLCRISIKNKYTKKTTTKMSFIIMENLFCQRKIRKTFDLKGSVRNRLVSESKQAVLQDENLLRLIRHNPIFIRVGAKQYLRDAIDNDTSFLSKMNVMDYSLLVGFDDDNDELVVGIVDYIRTFTWDKKLENWVKESMFLGYGGKEPTIISPQQYKNRFREAMDRYFWMSPDNYDFFS